MKIRIISDLHLDINEKHPLCYNDDVFTIICGDTAQSPSNGIAWIKDNIKRGLVICGNHMPYENFDLTVAEKKTMQEFRNEYATAFPLDADITYFDANCGVISKEIDGILFVGTVMYTDMSIKHNIFNPTGDVEFNCRASNYHMNDFKCGLIRLDKDAIVDIDNPFCLYKDSNKDAVTRMTAIDYAKWFNDSKDKIDSILTENENREQPLPVVFFTHHPLVADLIHHSYYMEPVYSIKDYNWSSYASDQKDWLLSHKSIKLYCCGHIHDIEKDWRDFYIENDSHKIRVINNARGYVYYGHDKYFNKDLIVNTDTF